MSPDHPHIAEESANLDKRLGTVLALNILIVAVEIIGGVLSGSLALFSDAMHNLSDVLAVVLALWARVISRRPPTVRHTYGLKRAEVLSALVNAVLLIGVTALIAREAVLRLLHPEPVAQGLMLAIALAALCVNLGSALLLRRHDKDDVNARSAYLHMAQDAFASLAVVVAASLAHTSAGPYADPIAALLVGVVVLRSAFALAWETLSTTLEGAPPDVDINQMSESIKTTFGPSSMHHIHIWEIGPKQRILTAHITLGGEMSGREIETLFLRIKGFLRASWQINHVTLEPEVAGCEQAGVLGRWEEDGRH
jgi:cobalt-zinc-cadmium efflux system protein